MRRGPGPPMHTLIVVVRRLHLVLTAAVGALALVAAGCGGSSVAVPELTSFTSAASASSSADSAKFELSFSMTMPLSDKPLSFSASGGFDKPAGRTQLTFDLSSLAELLKSFGQSFGGKVTGDMGDPSDWKLDAIKDGDLVYVHFPLIADQLPAGKTWVKGDLKELSGANAGDLSQFGSFAGTDPRDVFGMLKAVSGSIEAVGSEEIRGVETSHYKATIDVAKLEQLVPADQRESLGGLDQAAAQAGVTGIPIEIWIDGDQRVRKLTFAVEAKQPGTSQTMKATFEVELYDYGKPLDITLPPGDQVVDAATLKTS
jgi:hypothetical protein